MTLIKEKFITILEEPDWQYKYRNNVEFEFEAYGGKLTSKIIRPDMVLIGNEVVGNLDVTGDGHIGGEKFLSEKGCITKIKATRKEKHFTVIGIINLLVEPICCILIIEGKAQLFYIRDSIYLSKEKVGDDIDREE